MIHAERHDSTLVLTLAHGKANAFDLEFREALTDAFRSAQSADVRGVVVTGTGSIFSAGVDLFRILNEEPPAAGSARGGTYLDRFLTAFDRSLHALFTFPKPVVAAINGHAIAGGCILASACDWRVMAEGSGRLAVPELLVGVPFPAVALEILRLALPPQVFQQFVFGGQAVTGPDALARGVVDEIVPTERLLARAIEMAARLGAIPPATFELTKRMVRQPALDRIERYRDAGEREMRNIWTAPEIHAHIRAYLERTVGKSR